MVSVLLFASVLAVTNATPEAVSPESAPATNVAPRAARITADKSYYDRKEGVAVFDGRVCVDDQRYQLHADKVFVYLDGTNELRRIAAIGHVAMTNEARRAYGTKATYFRRNGLVVLFSGDHGAAEVRDEAKGEAAAQVLRGSKIKFWIDSEQVEVIDAEITAPVDGSIENMKGVLR